MKGERQRRSRRSKAIEEQKRKSRLRRHAAVASAIVVCALLGAYGAVSFYYSNHFFHGTVINGADSSEQTVAEVEARIAADMQHYDLTVYARDVAEETIAGRDISYAYRSNGAVQRLMDEQKPWLWIAGLFGGRELTAEADASYDREILMQKIQGLSCMQPAQQKPPVDAYIAFQNHGFVIIPEDEGSTLDAERTCQVIEGAVRAGKAKVRLDDHELYQTVAVTKDDPALAKALASYQNYVNASITYDIGEDRVVLDGMTMKDWLVQEDDGTYTMDEERFDTHLGDFVYELAQTYDTINTDRVFTTTDGRRVVVYAYEYGWQIDQESEMTALKEEIANGEFVEREPIYSKTANSHDESDVGDSYIEVDLGLQHMYYYMDGILVFESDFISGKPDGEHETHPGIFDIHDMESPSTLKGRMKSDGTPEYETKVQYWIDFDGGIGFHDAPWQTHGFGGTLYQQYGSHGCINLPPESAAVLYSIVRWEDPVVVFN